MRKHAISIFLILALLASLLPAGIPKVNATSETVIYELEYGGKLYFDKSTGTIVDCSEDTTSADIPAEIEGVSVTAIGSQAFSHCKELHSVSIPATIISISADAFRYCPLLEWLYVEEENPNYSTDGNALFDKEQTTLLYYAEGLGCPCGYALFYEMPSTVTEIADYAFFNNVMISEIVFPESLKTIGDYAFLNCTGLDALYFQGDAPEVGTHAFSVYDEKTGEYSPLPHATVFVPEDKQGWTVPLWNSLPSELWERHFHDYVSVTKNPTCTEDGYEGRACSCGYVEILVVLPATGHTYSYGICWYCGDKESEHQCSYRPYVTAPTCTEDGYTTYICSCKDSYVDDYVPATGHDYHEGYCTRCGEADPDLYIPPAYFEDVDEDAWYKESVDFVVAKGLMQGVSDERFDPEGFMTRAMLVTVLWRYAGEPAEGANVFSDVADSEWYTEAVAWAAENNIVTGIGNGRFDPDGEITREQMAAILYRFSKLMGLNTGRLQDPGTFPDSDKISDYAIDPMAWAIGEGLITGSKIGDKVYLDPQGNATRAQVATILMRFIENLAK